MEQFFDLPRSWRKWTGRPYEALNVNSFDEVPDNSWFTNRNGAVPLSLETVRRGDLGALLRKANPLGAAESSGAGHVASALCVDGDAGRAGDAVVLEVGDPTVEVAHGDHADIVVHYGGVC